MQHIEHCCYRLQRTPYHCRTPCVKVLMTQNKMLDSSVRVGIDEAVSTRACGLVMTNPVLSKCLDIVVVCHVGWANIGCFWRLKTSFSQMSEWNNQFSPCFLPSSSFSSDHHYHDPQAPLPHLRPRFPYRAYVSIDICSQIFILASLRLKVLTFVTLALIS